MTMIGKDCPIHANAFCLSSEKRDSSAAMSPAETLCFDIFSPPPGDSDVISQVERLSSNETKIAPRLVRIAVGSSEWGSSGIGRLQVEWICNLSLPPVLVAIHAPWDLVDDDDVDLLGSDLVQHGLEGGPIERRAGEGAIIEAVGNEPPALVGLALDIGLAGFALGVEGVEGEIEIMLGRFARGDRAALRLGNDRFHAAPLRWLARGRLCDPERGRGFVSAAAGA